MELFGQPDRSRHGCESVSDSRAPSQTGGTTTAEEVKNGFQGITSAQETLLKFYAGHNKRFALTNNYLRVGIFL